GDGVEAEDEVLSSAICSFASGIERTMPGPPVEKAKDAAGVGSPAERVRATRGGEGPPPPAGGAGPEAEAQGRRAPHGPPPGPRPGAGPRTGGQEGGGAPRVAQRDDGRREARRHLAHLLHGALGTEALDPRWDARRGWAEQQKDEARGAHHVVFDQKTGRIAFKRSSAAAISASSARSSAAS